MDGGLKTTCLKLHSSNPPTPLLKEGGVNFNYLPQGGGGNQKKFEKGVDVWWGGKG